MTDGMNKVVVKVGGSLYDLPDLESRLRRFLASLETKTVLLVPGGGALADAVRKLDGNHFLGEEVAHWLGLRALNVAAHFLSVLLRGSRIVEHPKQWKHGSLTVLDPYAFARLDRGRAGELPHCWSVTSDSIAARAARVAGAQRLILLKSVTIPPGMDWREVAQRGWVDAYFAEAIGGLMIGAGNLRDMYHTES
jgi:aspartokinase-like uncharacterized kinase